MGVLRRVGVRTLKGEVNLRRLGVLLEGATLADFALRGMERVLLRLRLRMEEKRLLVRTWTGVTGSEGREFSGVSSGEVGGVREESVEVLSSGFSIPV